MSKDDEKRIAAKLAKTPALLRVRNISLEKLHAGKADVSRIGDRSGVFVLDANGWRIPIARSRASMTKVDHRSEERYRSGPDVMAARSIRALQAFPLPISE